MLMDGYAYLNAGEIPFHLEDDILTLYFEKLGEPEREDYTAVNDIIVRKRGMLAGGYCLMHLEFPLSEFELAPFPHTTHRRISWLIEDYDESLEVTEIKFRFKELNYFFSSASQISYDSDYFIFKRSPDEMVSFELNLEEQDPITAQLYNCCTATIGASPAANAYSELSLSFNQTKDYYYLRTLFACIMDTFSFICNRQNLTLESATLVGKSSSGHTSTSTMKVFDKYKEPIEEEKEISKTISYSLMINHFSALIQLIANNYFSERGTVSVNGVHPSTLKRSLIDLRQSLSITSAFEHHVRSFLPSIFSKERVNHFFCGMPVKASSK